MQAVPPPPLSLNLPQYAVIRASGPDAATFLQGQLSNDFVLMQAHEARFAAYCNPKGRMLASFIAKQHREDPDIAPAFDLLVAADLLESILKRLRMFVLRDKVELRDMREHTHVCGHLAPDQEMSQATLNSTQLRTNLNTQTWTLTEGRINLPSSAGFLRQLSVIEGATPSTPDATHLAYWTWLEAHSGTVMVQAATSELFVPQMLNYESIGGVNFKKGCYPGQEVVARSQFRGQIKRRGTLLLSMSVADTAPDKDAPNIAVGAEIYPNDKLDEPCGVVALSAKHQGTTALFASLQTQALQTSQRFICQGLEFTAQALPYPLLEDI